MSAEDILRSSENTALENNQFISNVTGKSGSNSKKKKRSFGALFFLTAIIAVFIAFFSTGNLIPSAISERLIEQTDVQYADAVESKLLVFQQAMYDGDMPENTADKLKAHGATLGYGSADSFTEANKGSGALSILFDGKVISASEIIAAVHRDARLYEAVNSATYSRAAYYYDDSAINVFRKLGASRNIYKDDDTFEEAMDKAMGEGSSVSVNNVGLFEKQRQKQDGTTETYYEYGQVGGNASSGAADSFVESVRSKNTAENGTQATLNAAGAINAADTMSKEQRSSLFFLAFMENISKMKAGLGNETRINDAMNYLYREEETEIIDVKTGETKTEKGSMLESKSLYSILAGEKIDAEEVENYSSDRVLKTVANQLGASGRGSAVTDTVVSKSRGLKAVIGRFIQWGEEALGSVLGKVTPTVDSSLVNNSFSTVKGIYGGEMLAEGAVNVGKELAKQSGATPGDASAVKSYARLNDKILALDAEVDRMNRSPFDITSKNTFLGSLVYKFAMATMKKGTLLNQFSSFLTVTASAVTSLLPATFADDENNSFLTNFGECETLGSIGAVGSASCAMVATFDTSTLNDTFNDAGFAAFVNANTSIDGSGVRTINDGSVLANFIKYNNERSTPVGNTDGGILDALKNNSKKVSFISNILQMILRFLNANEDEKRIASGAAFITSSSNQDWEQYKYAQRYVSLARATEALRRYDGDTTAFTNVKFFEGYENPVIAYINEYIIAKNQ